MRQMHTPLLHRQERKKNSGKQLLGLLSAVLLVVPFLNFIRNKPSGTEESVGTIYQPGRRKAFDTVPATDTGFALAQFVNNIFQSLTAATWLYQSSSSATSEYACSLLEEWKPLKDVDWHKELFTDYNKGRMADLVRNANNGKSFNPSKVYKSQAELDAAGVNDEAFRAYKIEGVPKDLVDRQDEYWDVMMKYFGPTVLEEVILDDKDILEEQHSALSLKTLKDILEITKELFGKTGYRNWAYLNQDGGIGSDGSAKQAGGWKRENCCGQKSEAPAQWIDVDETTGYSFNSNARVYEWRGTAFPDQQSVPRQGQSKGLRRAGTARNINELHENILMNPFITLHEINQFLVKPLTRGSAVSFANFIRQLQGDGKYANVDRQNKPHPRAGDIDYFISHGWANPYWMLVEAAEKHCASVNCDPASTYYWVCTFANDQHHFGTNADIEKDPFAKAMKLRSFKGIIMVNKDTSSGLTSSLTLDRVWCAFELAYVIYQRKRVWFYCNGQVVKFQPGVTLPCSDKLITRLEGWDFETDAGYTMKADFDKIKAWVDSKIQGSMLTHSTEADYAEISSGRGFAPIQALFQMWAKEKKLPEPLANDSDYFKETKDSLPPLGPLPPISRAGGDPSSSAMRAGFKKGGLAPIKPGSSMSGVFAGPEDPKTYFIGGKFVFSGKFQAVPKELLKVAVKKLGGSVGSGEVDDNTKALVIGGVKNTRKTSSKTEAAQLNSETEILEEPQFMEKLAEAYDIDYPKNSERTATQNYALRGKEIYISSRPSAFKNVNEKDVKTVVENAGAFTVGALNLKTAVVLIPQGTTNKKVAEKAAGFRCPVWTELDLAIAMKKRSIQMEDEATMRQFQMDDLHDDAPMRPPLSGGLELSDIPIDPHPSSDGRMNFGLRGAALAPRRLP